MTTMITKRLNITSLSLLVLAANAVSQMSKRTLHRYGRPQFERTAPALGSQVPHLALPDLLGKLHSLADLRGQRLVLIGGGFT